MKMSEKINGILLTIGNEIVKSLKADKELQKCAPKGSWQVACALENSTLTFRIFLDYDAFHKGFARIPAEPELWITLVAINMAGKLREQAFPFPWEILIGFVANRENKEDWKISCTAADLMDAQDKVKDEYLEEAAKIFMLAMKDNGEGG
jgi:hypothetical protein